MFLFHTTHIIQYLPFI
ncbi:MULTISPECIES: hypothetical protein [Phocaeicola]